MSQDSIIVGKQLLDTLTTGMYAENRIIFREYIQNSADAIDKAVTAGIINREDGQIDITIDVDHREICIRDNGIGIPAEEVYHSLGDIGKSQKNYMEDRGFRGIGRLGGVAYCEELRFVTSYKGQDCKTVTHWDCRKLKELLLPDVGRDMSIADVIRAVTKIKTESEEPDQHYFEVILSNIDKEHDNLLDVDDIQDYLSQVAPVPFNYQHGIVLQEINRKLKELGHEPEEFKVYLKTIHQNELIYKPYRRHILAGKDKEKDFIQVIEFFEGYKKDGSLWFLGWYGKTQMTGTVKDLNVRSLRLRKRNILIGDDETLNSFFGDNPTYQGYNKWFVGEIYVFDDALLPNNRRDDFAKNATYFEFKREVEKTTRRKLAKLPHEFSDDRSDEKELRKHSQTASKIQEDLLSGVTETRKEQLLEELDSTQKAMKKIMSKGQPKKESVLANKPEVGNIPPDSSNNAPKREEIRKKAEELLEQSEDLKTKVEQAKNYTVEDWMSPYPREVRAVIDRIFNVIDKVLDEGLARELKQRVKEDLQVKPKKDKHK